MDLSTMENSEGGGGGRRKPHVLIIPFPAQGHLLPLLDLARHLSTLDAFAITVATTPKNLPLLSPLLSTCPSIQPLLLPFPSHPSLPPGVENTKDLPPSLRSFRLFMANLANLRPPLLDWATSGLAHPPTSIISDFFLGWTNGLAKELGVPRLTFSPSAAFTLSIGRETWATMRRPPPSAAEDEAAAYVMPFPALPGSPSFSWREMSPLYRAHEEGEAVSEALRDGFVANMESWGLVFNTFRGLEGEYVDHLRRLLGHERVWAVGPLSALVGGSSEDRGGASSVPVAELMAWLDGRESGSVLYVCFGTQVVLSQAQTAAVATALERSGVHFVWSMKTGPAAGAAVVPEGFEERTRARGLVIKGWAPQVQVLSHESVGSFVTHCGWNSILEAAAAGVVTLMWPMKADQFVNARLLEDKGIGRRVCEGVDSVPDRVELSRAMRDSVCGRSGEGRARAKELSVKASEAVKRDGSSWRDMDDLVESLKNLEPAQQ